MRGRRASGADGRRPDCRRRRTGNRAVDGRPPAQARRGETAAGCGRPKDEARHKADKEAWQAEAGQGHRRLRAVAVCAVANCTRIDYDRQGLGAIDSWVRRRSE